MSDNWTPASTPQGRERLKELMDGNHKVVCKAFPNNFGRNYDESFIAEKFGNEYRLTCWVPVGGFDGFNLDGIEFLDPSPTPQQPDENGLLPCPFCGGKASGIHIPFNFYTVECSACKFFILERETPQLAMSAWNRRAGKEPNA